MRYTDLTNEELEGLLELAIAVKESKISMQFFKCHINLLETAIYCRRIKASCKSDVKNSVAKFV